MKKNIAMLVVFATIVTASNVVFAGSVDEVKVSFPFTISSEVYKETPYWIFKKIEDSSVNATKWDSGFQLLIGHISPTKECRSDDRYSWWEEAKPGCNKVDIAWAYIGNPKTREVSDTKVILLDVDLGKSMSWDEQQDYIKKLSMDKSTILGKGYAMVENPKYYETKVLSDDKSVYILPIKKWYEPKDISFTWNEGNNYTYYKDSSGQYYRSFGIRDTIFYWEKIFKNDEYEKKVESSFAMCSSNPDTSSCIDSVVKTIEDTAFWKILGYENETNPDEEIKALRKDLSGIFDE